MTAPEPDEPPIFTHWMRFLEWLLPTTEKFPRQVRFTFSDRIDNLALEIALDLVEARYTRDKLPILHRINLHLEKLLRLCPLLQALPSF